AFSPFSTSARYSASGSFTSLIAGGVSRVAASTVPQRRTRATPQEDGTRREKKRAVPLRPALLKRFSKRDGPFADTFSASSLDERKSLPTPASSSFVLSERATTVPSRGIWKIPSSSIFWTKDSGAWIRSVGDAGDPSTGRLVVGQKSPLA